MNAKFERVRNGKFFLKRDLVLYFLTVAVIAGLFLGVFLTRDNTALEKIEIFYNENIIFIYEFSGKGAIIKNADYVEVRLLDGKTEVTVKTPRGMNRIIIGERYAEVVEADCNGKDCVRSSPKITRGGDAIFCLPHALKIVGTGENGNEVLL